VVIDAQTMKMHSASSSICMKIRLMNASIIVFLPGTLKIRFRNFCKFSQIYVKKRTNVLKQSGICPIADQNLINQASTWQEN